MGSPRCFATAGKRANLLARELLHLQDGDPVVLALPRGGVAVGHAIASVLAAPLDIVLVRKIGAPWQPELAVGAVADSFTPEILIDDPVVREFEIPAEYLQAETARQIGELERRRRAYCAGRAVSADGGTHRDVVDDGIATGATMRAALRAVRHRGPARLVLAVPVAARQTLAGLRNEVDEAVCLEASANLGAIGYYYDDFHQMTDREVIDLLAEATPPAR